MLKSFFIGAAAAVTVTLNVSAIATILHARGYAAIEPQEKMRLGHGNECQDYAIGSIASGNEVADMLEAAAHGARRFGCVSINIYAEK